MSVIIFAGPTLSAAEGAAELDATFLPPVAQGDVYRASRKRPVAIGIIDGFFEWVPAVWHKEILWAMKEGIHVFGSASMGALRAAELEQFGMEGVGTVFELFRDGILEDDDEVAVVHGPAETGYQAHSEAMVNIRQTLAQATACGTIRPSTRLELERVAKGLFYPRRTYQQILRQAAEGVPAQELDALRAWLPEGRVDQKREDALAMLRVMRRRLAGRPAPKQVRYTFEHTDMWEQARSYAGDLRVDREQGATTILLDELLDELRLKGEAYERGYREALARVLALDEAERQHLPVSVELVEETTEAFRRERGLLTAADVERWCNANHISWERFTSLMEDEACLRWVQELARSEVMGILPDHLRLTGEYPRLAEQAQTKKRTLESDGTPNPGLATRGLSEEELMRWYFEKRLGRPVARDLVSYAKRVGFSDEDAFRRALLREFEFVQLGWAS
jgi:hypothetical protein